MHKLTLSNKTEMIPAEPHILAALKVCPHCPFLVKWSEHAEGIERDSDFEVDDVDGWFRSNPWPCHKDDEPCRGQKLFRAGKLNVTREELIEIWVNGADPSDLVKVSNDSGTLHEPVELLDK